jgi:hypothetical protein
LELFWLAAIAAGDSGVVRVFTSFVIVVAIVFMELAYSHSTDFYF